MNKKIDTKKLSKKIMIQSKGITLIALVVTIIVLLILAGVAINLSIGNNGILDRAKEATKKWEEASLNEENKLNELVDGIDNAGKDIDIKFDLNPSGWTNKDVTVTAHTEAVGKTIQTSKDGVTWSDTEEQTFSENGIMYAKFKNWSGKEGLEYKIEITTIDKEIPTITDIEITGDTAIVRAKDETSGIVGYAITEDTTKPTEFTKCDNIEDLEEAITGLDLTNLGHKHTGSCYEQVSKTCSVYYESKTPTTSEGGVCSSNKNCSNYQKYKDGWHVYIKKWNHQSCGQGTVTTKSRHCPSCNWEYGDQTSASYTHSYTAQSDKLICTIKERMYYAWVIDEAGNISEGKPFITK